MLRICLFGSAALLIAISPCVAQDGAASANAGGQGGSDWRIYRPDMKFADVFGRPVEIRRDGAAGVTENPSLAEVERASPTSASNVFAKEALRALLGSVAPGPSICKDMLSLKLPWVRMLSAEDVPAGNEMRAYCKVLGVIDKEINFEVDMPLSTEWNGKYLMGGNGGFLGNLINLTQKSTLQRAYAIAITDTGHMTPKDAGASWG